MSIREVLERPVENRADVAAQLYEKSVAVLIESQQPTGGTSASMKGSRYFGHTYPRDHAYVTRAMVSAGKYADAKQALTYILNVELSPEGVMAQRYDETQKSSSNKPPQIDGNAQTLIALAYYTDKSGDRELFERYADHVTKLLQGLDHHTTSYPHGDLVYSVNGIIEFAPFEEGYEIYTNACAYKACRDIAHLFSSILDDAKTAKALRDKAERIKRGIGHYLYIPEYGGFVFTVRREPNPSVVHVANLKSFLALIDFDVFDADDPKILSSLEYQLAGTKNEATGGYDRYNASIGRHNFGNGPWPMVMMRLVHAYVKMGKNAEAVKALDWVLNVALINQDVELGLPEHVVTKEELLKEFHGFMRTFDINPREERKKEYEKNERSKMMEKYGVAYPINPLVWSHAQFVLVWNEVRKNLL
jgi:GH15 family glucan-1,4-alpha-glucosidase